jgi:hypothetical protein
MDFLDLLLGRDNKRRRENLPGILGAISRWLVGCGCLLLAAVIGGIILLLAGIINFGGQNTVTVIIVVVTIIVAIASLIRSSMGY